MDKLEEFRQKLSEWFKRESEKPLFIIRGEERFVLLKEEEYFDMKDSIESLSSALRSHLNDEKTYTSDEVFKRKRK